MPIEGELRYVMGELTVEPIYQHTRGNAFSPHVEHDGEIVGYRPLKRDKKLQQFVSGEWMDIPITTLDKEE